MRPDEWRIEFLFRLTFVALSSIMARLRAPLFGRRHWRRYRPGPWTGFRWRGRRRSPILEPRCRGMPRLSRHRRALTRTIHWPALTGRRNLRQTVLLPQPLLYDLLHRLTLFVRYLHFRRGRRRRWRCHRRCNGSSRCRGRQPRGAGRGRLLHNRWSSHFLDGQRRLFFYLRLWLNFDF